MFEDWASLGFFWLSARDMFYQFFTRYVLNDSAAWTEEIARYLLICTVFAASSPPCANRHIHVDFLYRLLPPRGRTRAVHAVDIARIRSSPPRSGSPWQMMLRMSRSR